MTARAGLFALAVIVVMGWASASFAATPQVVTFASADKAKTQITAYLFRPDGTQQPLPVVVALHGCSGLLNRAGHFRQREQDWVERFLKLGYAVLYPDSYNSRGLRSVCGESDRSINPAGRARDVAGAIAWLDTQTFVVRDRIAVVGWSNGGSTALRFVASKDAKSVAGVVAFYPGCTPLLRRDWQATVPLRILIGGADDWTPASSCKTLVDRSPENVGLHIYPDAYHEFDAPALAVHVREGLVAFSAGGTGAVHIGTNDKARQAAIGDVTQFLADRLGR